MRTRTAVLITTALIWSLGAAFVALVVQPFVQPIPSAAPAVDPARLERHVRKLSVDFHPRSYDRVDNLDAAARYITDEFKAAGAVVQIQEVKVEGESYKNVIARFGPEQGPVLVIGAHYDSHADTSKPGVAADTHTPGADDNASGVAGLIELAHLLGRQPQARPIELVAYTLEEPPHFRTEHMGSAWHAKSLQAAGREVRLMLSLEMIGYFSDEAGSQKYPIAAMSYLYPDRGNFIALVGKLDHFAATRRAKALMAGASDLPVHSLNGPVLVQGIDYSDHRNYWRAGFPALMVTDTAFQRNARYHRAGDTADTLDYVRSARVVQSVYALTQQF